MGPIGSWCCSGVLPLDPSHRFLTTSTLKKFLHCCVSPKCHTVQVQGEVKVYRVEVLLQHKLYHTMKNSISSNLDQLVLAFAISPKRHGTFLLTGFWTIMEIVSITALREGRTLLKWNQIEQDKLHRGPFQHIMLTDWSTSSRAGDGNANDMLVNIWSVDIND